MNPTIAIFGPLGLIILLMTFVPIRDYLKGGTDKQREKSARIGRQRAEEMNREEMSRSSVHEINVNTSKTNLLTSAENNDIIKNRFNIMEIE